MIGISSCGLGYGYVEPRLGWMTMALGEDDPGTGLDGALRDELWAVEPGVARLVHAVPVEVEGDVPVTLVVDVNDDNVALARVDGRDRFAGSTRSRSSGLNCE
jgi:hypothetical protein